MSCESFERLYWALAAVLLVWGIYTTWVHLNYRDWGPHILLVMIALSFAAVLSGVSQGMSQDVAKCSGDCYIEFKVNALSGNRATCLVVESRERRIPCSSQIRLPSSLSWFPTAQYRVRGELELSERRATALKLWMKSRIIIGKPPRWAQVLLESRQRIRLKLEEVMSVKVQGVAWALISGRRELLPPADRDMLSQAGLIHFIAISGLHVGMVLGLWISLARVVITFVPLTKAVRGYAQSIAYIAGSMGLLTLLVWWGAPSSALRSAGMWIVALAGRWMGIRCRGADALGAAGIFLLLWNPLLSRDLGFQLSSVAVGGLLWVGGTTKGALLGVGNSLRSSLSATLSTMPILADAFGTVALTGGTLSFLALPLITYVVAPIVILLAVTWSYELTVHPLAVTLSEFAVGSFMEAASVLAKTATSIKWEPLYLVGSLPVWLLLRCKHWCFDLLGFILSLVFLLNLNPPTVDRLRIDALDVGQGDATLIRTSQGYHVLFDTGGKLGQAWGQDGYNQVVSELRRLGIKHLNLIVISHSDPDHTGALEAVLRSFEVEHITLNHRPGRDTRLDQTLSTRCDVSLKCTLKIGSVMTWRRDEVDFTLYPSGEVEGAKLTDNESSTALAVGSGQHHALMTADLPRWSELALLRRINKRMTLVKLGHHGSRTSTDPRFLEALSPDIVWSSHGHRNRFGHPHSEVVTRLEERNLEILSTAELGTLSFGWTQTGWQASWDTAEEDLESSEASFIMKLLKSLKYPA